MTPVEMQRRTELLWRITTFLMIITGVVAGVRVVLWLQGG